MIAADAPEFAMLASAAGIDVKRMAAGFNDPAHFFDHLTLEELERFTASCDRFAELQKTIMSALARVSPYPSATRKRKK